MRALAFTLTTSGSTEKNKSDSQTDKLTANCLQIHITQLLTLFKPKHQLLINGTFAELLNKKLEITVWGLCALNRVLHTLLHE